MNFYAFTVPLPCEEREGVFDEVYTLWDKIIIKERSKDMTLRSFMKRVTKKVLKGDEDWEIGTISYGPNMIYANFLQSLDDEILDECIWDLASDAVSSDDVDFNDFQEEGLKDTKTDEEKDHEQLIIRNKRILDFTIVVENIETEEEIELPVVRLVKYKDKDQ